MLRTATLANRSAFERFLASPCYCVCVMAFAGICHILAAELFGFALFLLLAIAICLFAEDLLALLPLIPAVYITPSASNNPAIYPDTVFSGARGVFLLVLSCLFVAVLCLRIIRQRKQFFQSPGKLFLSYLVLCTAYLLSGIGSPAHPEYWKHNLLFALLQSGCLLLPYWLFSRGVNWKNVRREYLFWMGFALGAVVALEILWTYATNTVVVDGIICRERIFTGWGMHNNLGFLLAMMIPFAFYLATKYRQGWLGTVIGSGFLICVFLTCSRNSIIAGSLVYAVCILLMLVYARNRRHNTLALIVVLALVCVSVALFHKQLLRLFSDLLGKGMDPSSRDTIYFEGLKLFARYPIFGVSFYSPGYLPWDFATLPEFSAFLPPRWHNTIVQLLTSCGAVGLAAYGFHRYQSIRMLLSRHHKEQVYIACAVGVLLLCSLLDCHFFNLGPTLLYSAFLAYAEHCPGTDLVQRKFPFPKKEWNV